MFTENPQRTMAGARPLPIRIPNHNQTIVRAPGFRPQHNQTIVRPIPGREINHNQTIVRR